MSDSSEDFGIQSMTDWMQASLEPVDHERFVWASNTYSAAAGMRMPVENPSARPLIEVEGKSYSLTDTPLNRGMTAVVRQLRELGEANPQAYLGRILHFAEILENASMFGDLIRDEGDGALMVSDAVLYGAAKGRMILTETHIGFDLEDVLAKARQYADEHPDAGQDQG